MNDLPWWSFIEDGWNSKRGGHSNLFLVLIHVVLLITKEKEFVSAQLLYLDFVFLISPPLFIFGR